MSLDWVHCNVCFAQPRPHGQSYFLSSCGHIVCDGCKRGARPAESCPQCKKRDGVSWVRLSSKLPPEVAPYFTDPRELISRLKETVEFQTMHQERLWENVKHEMLVAKCLELEDEEAQLIKQNQELDLKIQQLIQQSPTNLQRWIAMNSGGSEVVDMTACGGGESSPMNISPYPDQLTPTSTGSRRTPPSLTRHHSPHPREQAASQLPQPPSAPVSQRLPQLFLSSQRHSPQFPSQHTPTPGRCLHFETRHQSGTSPQAKPPQTTQPSHLYQHPFIQSRQQPGSLQTSQMAPRHRMHVIRHPSPLTAHPSQTVRKPSPHSIYPSLAVHQHSPQNMQTVRVPSPHNLSQTTRRPSPQNMQTVRVPSPHNLSQTTRQPSPQNIQTVRVPSPHNLSQTTRRLSPHNVRISPHNLSQTAGVPSPHSIHLAQITRQFSPYTLQPSQAAQFHLQTSRQAPPLSMQAVGVPSIHLSPHNMGHPPQYTKYASQAAAVPSPHTRAVLQTPSRPSPSTSNQTTHSSPGTYPITLASPRGHYTYRTPLSGTVPPLLGTQQATVAGRGPASQ